jgi:hypothetical protein
MEQTDAFEISSVDQAIKLYVADQEARCLSKSSLRQSLGFLERQFLPWLKNRGHAANFLTKYDEYAIIDTDKKRFPIMDSLASSCRLVCLFDISCSTTAADSGSKNVTFQPIGIGRVSVLSFISGFISDSGPELPATLSYSSVSSVIARPSSRSSVCPKWASSNAPLLTLVLSLLSSLRLRSGSGSSH